ncbi:MAG: FAD-dependent oxidoreductase [Hydrogenophaga sp.]|uniref:FAD-dependent oxidoreductase n=1 Tax=Hydrogenophaga sp. TaxID=1904254 RepID=UPI001D808379|nr:FAD-dependent oxidoreductase [Hydrogenophaga sp.]MBX3610796.1 FAD-dependent oxidoreductase [Hydrogenophaga sp.]
MRSGITRLLLLGAGHAHVQVLAELARHHPADLQVTLLSPHPSQTYSGMVPGLVAGRYSVDEVQIPLAPLLQAAHTRWVAGRCVGIDSANTQVHWQGPDDDTVHALPYDLLSIDTGAVLDRERLDAELPGAREHTLPLRPIDAFVGLWPEVVELAQQRPLSVAVIGAGAAGIETVFAAAQRLRADGVPGSTFTLVTGGPEPGPGYIPGVRARIQRRLRREGIHVLREACTRIDDTGVHLANGAVLRCDVPLLAIGTHAPTWLRGSGLALDDAGHVLVNRFQQSTSHANVFAVGDVSTRDDHPHPRSGVYAVRAGPPLAHNLLAALEGRPLKPHWPPGYTLNLLSCGTGFAIASWGPLHAQGAWVWRWKDRIDRAFMARYCGVHANNAGPRVPHPEDERRAR